MGIKDKLKRALTIDKNRRARQLADIKEKYGSDSPEAWEFRQKHADALGDKYGDEWSSTPTNPNSNPDVPLPESKTPDWVNDAIGGPQSPTSVATSGNNKKPQYGGSQEYEQYLRDKADYDTRSSQATALAGMGMLATQAQQNRLLAGTAGFAYDDALKRQLQSRDDARNSIGGINQAVQSGIGMRNQALANNDLRNAVAGNNQIRNQALASTNLERSASQANSLADSYLNRISLQGTAQQSIGMRNQALASSNLRADAADANVQLNGYLAQTDLVGSAQAANQLRTNALNDGRDLNSVATQANQTRTNALNQINLESRGRDANRQRALTLSSLDYEQGAGRAGQLRDDAFRSTDLEGAAQAGENMLGEGATGANALRDQALVDADITTASDEAIAKNDALAQERLTQQVGLLNRSARGLAGSMGEGSALALQQAIASSGVGAADLMSQDQNTRAQLANDTRYAATLQRSQDQLNTANLNAQQQYLSAQDRSALNYQGAYDQAGNRLMTANANANDLMTANALKNQAYQTIGEAQAQQTYGSAYDQAANNIGVANQNALTTYQGAADQNANILSVGNANANTAYQGASDQASNTLFVGNANANRSYQGAYDQTSNQLNVANANANQWYGAGVDQMNANLSVGTANADRSMYGATQQAANTLNTANANASDYLQGYAWQAQNAIGVADSNANSGYQGSLATGDAWSRLYGQDMAASGLASDRQAAFQGMANNTTTNWADSVQDYYNTQLVNQQTTLGNIANVAGGNAAVAQSDKNSKRELGGQIAVAAANSLNNLGPA